MGPLAIGLFVTGLPSQAAGIIALGVLVIGLVNDVLRPRLIGTQNGLPDYLGMITTFGGIAVLQRGAGAPLQTVGLAATLRY